MKEITPVLLCNNIYYKVNDVVQVLVGQRKILGIPKSTVQTEMIVPKALYEGRIHEVRNNKLVLDLNKKDKSIICEIEIDDIMEIV